MAKIDSLKKAHAELVKLGFEATLREDSVAVKVGGSGQPFAAVITHDAEMGHFRFTCLLARLGEVGKHLTKFCVAALDANSRIAPFAYALLTDSDDPSLDDEKMWPVVLTHAVPLGDLSSSEMESAMRSLVGALLDSRSVLSVLTEADSAKEPVKEPAKPTKKKKK